MKFLSGLPRTIHGRSAISSLAILLAFSGCLMQFSNEPPGTRSSQTNFNGMTDECFNVFKEKAAPVLAARCITCHGSGAFKVTADPAQYQAFYTGYLSAGQVDPAVTDPVKSIILQKSGQFVDHVGGKVLDPNGSEFASVKEWITREIAGKCQVSTAPNPAETVTPEEDDPNGSYDF